ncbi:MAG: hypothetical protein ACOVT5_02755, partial [Armatimonadaceae bacterium]
MASQNKSDKRRNVHRAWYLDFATGLAFAAVAFFWGRSLRVKPVAARVVFLGCAGMAWFHFKSA